MPLTNEQKEESSQRLAKMIELLGFAADISETEGERGFALNLKTADPGRLIGRKGHYLQSLELLLNRMLRKAHKQFPWVELDIDGYQRKTRRRSGTSASPEAERLHRMAVDTAKEVKRWGQPKKLGPFEARERRVIHMVLREDSEVESESAEDEGGGMKKVVIRLAAPRAE